MNYAVFIIGFYIKKPCNQCFNPETAAGNQLKNKNYEKNFTNVSC